VIGWTVLRFIFFLLSVCFSNSSNGQIETCGSFFSSRKSQMTWCEFSRQDSHQNTRQSRLLVYFHGFGQSAKRLSGNFNYPPLGQMGADLPAIISFSFGRFLFLKQPIDRLEFAKFIETKIAESKSRLKISEVILMGDSMGGFNALQVMKTISLPLSKAILICPALVQSNPFNDQDWQKDPDASQGNWIQRTSLKNYLKWSFDSEKDFVENSLFKNLRSKDWPSGFPPNMLVMTAGRDGYGFKDSHQVLCEGIRKTGVSCHLETTETASHCQVSPETIRKFILQP